MRAELQSDVDAARQVESTMLEITELLQLFSTNIEKQKEEIEALYSNTIDSKENLSKGNEQLAQARQQGSAARFYIVFFFSTLTFSMLFIHYVSD